MKNFKISTMIFFYSLLLSISCNEQSIFTFEDDKIIPPITVEKADYYVATTGNDNNPGTFDQPWASWQKAFAVAQTGDTVFIRGGIYGIPENRPVKSAGSYAGFKSGTSTGYISIFNYPGETPILDCNTSSRIISDGIYLQNAKYWHIKGLTVKKALQKTDGSTITSGFQLKDCDYITVENCIAHNIEGTGFKSLNGVGHYTYINCDSYDNFDPYTGLPNVKGGNADGFYAFDHDLAPPGGTAAPPARFSRTRPWPGRAPRGRRCRRRAPRPAPRRAP